MGFHAHVAEDVGAAVVLVDVFDVQHVSAQFASVEVGSRVSPRRARHFSLLRQRKVPKRKATRSLGPCAALRATCAARSGRKFQKLVCFAAFGHLKFLIRPLLRCSAQPERGRQKAGYQNKYAPWRVLGVFGCWYCSFSPPFLYAAR